MIGYLGPENSFTYQAASSFYVQNELTPYANIHFLFEALKKDRVEGIVVPIENNVDGTINLVQENLYKYGFHINKEIILDENLALISKSNNIKTIKNIIANPAMLQQCRNTLYDEIGKYKELTEYASNKAVRKLFELDDSYGAIAPPQQVFGELNILLSDIQDRSDNKTRFIFIKKTLEIIGFHNKVSIVVEPKHGNSGALYDILHEFSVRSINIAKIESRPSEGKLDASIFYIDFEGNIDDQLVRETLEILRIKTLRLKILGSYFSKK